MYVELSETLSHWNIQAISQPDIIYFHVYYEGFGSKTRSKTIK